MGDNLINKHPSRLISLGLAGLQLWFVGFVVAATPQGTPGWTLVWSDEFTQADGSSPDPAKWGYALGGSGWGNGEFQFYTARTNNARIEGGQLVIEAHQENYNGSDFTSARLLTKGKCSWTYGRIEARIKIPRGQGLWPAFWMLGANKNSGGWPACGEIDIMENIGKEPTIVHGTIHGPGYSGGNGIGRPYALTNGAAFADDFHLYAVEWTPNQIRWFVDGQPYFTVTPTNLPTGTSWVFTQPQFLLLNLAVGGYWPGNPDGTTTFPQRMIVDYVRVYALPNNLHRDGNVWLGDSIQFRDDGSDTAAFVSTRFVGGGGSQPISEAVACHLHSDQISQPYSLCRNCPRSTGSEVARSTRIR